MGTYDSQIATAQRIIAAKGEACVWTPAVPGEAASSDTPWITPPDTVDPIVTYTGVPIAFFPLSRQFSQLLHYLKGSEVKVGSLYGLMPAVAFTPDLQDIVTRTDGTKLGITAIDPLSPNGEVILYTIEFAT